LEVTSYNLNSIKYKILDLQRATRHRWEWHRPWRLFFWRNFQKRFLFLEKRWLQWFSDVKCYKTFSLLLWHLKKLSLRTCLWTKYVSPCLTKVRSLIKYNTSVLFANIEPGACTITLFTAIIVAVSTIPP